MLNIVVAGATGYLGSYLVRCLQNRAYDFKAVGRTKEKLKALSLSKEQMIIAEVTQPESLKGCLDATDIVISTVGITRQKDGLTYMDVDYQANMNLLLEAKRAGVKKFIYVSAIHGERMRHLKIMEAKEKFVDALKASGLEYVIVRPNGFFSDMRDFLDMARQGRVYLFGDGTCKLNPIHGKDLAHTMLDHLNLRNEDLEVGGPDILSQNEIAALALKSLDKAVRIIHLPDWVRLLAIKLMRIFTSSKTYGPIEFFLTMMGQDNIAPAYGTHHLEDYYQSEAKKLT